jgi:hypothetical protein
MVAVGRDGGVWQRVSRKERCPVCGHDSWCGMIVGEVVACMRQADGARFSKPGKDNQIRHYHDWPDRAAPIPIRPAPARPVDWAAPAATTCRALYTAIAARYAARPHSKACAAEATRRFGDRALDALAAADYCEIDERDLLAWLDAEGRVADAKSAGVLGDDGKLAPALRGRKVYAFRLPDGTVANLRGRDLTGRAALKVLDLAGGYEERGADAGLYHAERVADVAGGAGWLHLAGGCEKADALIAAGFTAVSTPGEGTLFDAALADLTARRVLSVAVWADAEDPKPRPDGTTPAMSVGRERALALGERLAAAGISVRVVEPAREPGSPKRDADGILRDGGPGALWDCWAASEDLAAFRARLGLVTDEGALVAQLRRELAERDATIERLRAWNQARTSTLQNQALKHEGRGALGVASVWEAHRERGDSFVDPKTEKRFVHVPLAEAGREVGYSDDTAAAALDKLHGYGLLEKRRKYEPVKVRDPETGELREQMVRRVYVHIPDASGPDFLQRVAAFDPETPPEERHGGYRPKRCPDHPDAPILVTTTRIETCGVCAQETDRTVMRVEHFSPEGEPISLADFRASISKPQDAGMGDGGPTADFSGNSNVLVDEGSPYPTSEETDTPNPQDAVVVPPTTVRCLSAGRGCVNRVPPDVDYCPDCELEGWHNRRGSSA